MDRLRGVAIGCGYFSRFHFDAWPRVPGVAIEAVCDSDRAKAEEAAARLGITRAFDDAPAMLDAIRPDFADIITPPATHAELVAACAERGISVICQKPLAPSLAEARAIVATAREAGIRLMVHENFRFQPWYREIRALLDAGAIGRKLHSLTVRSRPATVGGRMPTSPASLTSATCRDFSFMKQVFILLIRFAIWRERSGGCLRSSGG